MGKAAFSVLPSFVEEHMKICLKIKSESCNFTVVCFQFLSDAVCHTPAQTISIVHGLIKITPVVRGFLFLTINMPLSMVILKQVFEFETNQINPPFA
jgi:hypothetical protein